MPSPCLLWCRHDTRVPREQAPRFRDPLKKTDYNRELLEATHYDYGEKRDPMPMASPQLKGRTISGCLDSHVMVVMAFFCLCVPQRDGARCGWARQSQPRAAPPALPRTCQAGVNSCQVGLWSAPLPRARAAEGGPRTYLRQQITSAETYEDVRPEYSPTPPRGGRHCVH